MEIEKSLERIELQLKAIWWDNLLYFGYILSTMFMIIFYLTNQKMMLLVAGVMAIIIYPITQILEKIQMKKIKEDYKK